MDKADNNIRIQHLKYFVAIGECLNFSEAAKKLFVTQPNLSHMINSLEKQLGIKLFFRNTKLVKLTPAGEILMSAAKEIIDKYDDTMKNLEQFSALNRDTLRIGYLGTPFNPIFPRCIPVFQNEHPDVKVTLQRFDPNFFLDAFENDLIDIGFSHRIDVESIGGLHYKKLFDVYLSIVAHKDHRLSKNSCVDLITIKNEPLIVPVETFSPHLLRKIMEICSKRGFSPQISQMTQSIDGYFQMIDSKMGIAILPESSRYLNYPNVRFIKINDNDDLNVEACYVWKDKLKPLSLQFITLIESIIKT